MGRYVQVHVRVSNMKRWIDWLDSDFTSTESIEYRFSIVLESFIKAYMILNEVGDWLFSSCMIDNQDHCQILIGAVMPAGPSCRETFP